MPGTRKYVVKREIFRENKNYVKKQKIWNFNLCLNIMRRDSEIHHWFLFFLKISFLLADYSIPSLIYSNNWFDINCIIKIYPVQISLCQIGSVSNNSVSDFEYISSSAIQRENLINILLIIIIKLFFQDFIIFTRSWKTWSQWWSKYFKSICVVVIQHSCSILKHII